MFFFGVFGIETKEKQIKDINNVTCGNCGRLSVYEVIKSYKFFHIFFIPLFKWGTKYYLVSRCCKSVFQIPIEKGAAIERGDTPEITKEDLQLIYSNETSANEVICPCCNRLINRQFTYCPHCGEKVK